MLFHVYIKKRFTFLNESEMLLCSVVVWSPFFVHHKIYNHNYAGHHLLITMSPIECDVH